MVGPAGKSQPRGPTGEPLIPSRNPWKRRKMRSSASMKSHLGERATSRKSPTFPYRGTSLMHPEEPPQGELVDWCNVQGMIGYCLTKALHAGGIHDWSDRSVVTRRGRMPVASRLRQRAVCTPHCRLLLVQICTVTWLLWGKQGRQGRQLEQHVDRCAGPDRGQRAGSRQGSGRRSKECGETNLKGLQPR